MEYVLIGIALFTALAVIGLLAYLIVHHKISTAGVTATLSGIRDQLHQVHAAAMAPVVVAPAPTVAAAPAALAQPVPVPAPTAPAAPVNPFLDWKAQGKDLMWIETFGGHPMSEADWPLAIAAGYVRPAAPTVDTTPAWTPRPTMTFADARGHPLPFDGKGTSYTITECPANVRVIAEQASGEWESAYVLKANDLSKPNANGQSGCELDANGPTVVISVDQEANSHTQVEVQG